MDIDFLDDLDLLDSDIMLNLPGGRRRRRANVPRVRTDPFIDIDDEHFMYKYRFSKAYASAVVELVKDDLSRNPRGFTITPQLQVACALRNWARHEIQDDTGDIHGISQPAVSIICKNVAEALAKLSRRLIKMPGNLAEQERSMEKFRSIANFPTVIGAIDCTHIRIKKTNAEGGQAYINRKGYSSINVQVICNADLKILDIVARWRGSVHDSRIFRESRIKQRFETGTFNGILLGDSGYPCTQYLLTPILNPRTQPEERYNAAHIRTRNTVERCFGLWKQRFRCLLRGMFGSIETAKTTIVACAILHNLALDMNEALPGENNELEEVPEVIHIQNNSVYPVPNTVRGNVRRRQFIETHFGNRQL